MSRFSEHWLALREGADANARASALLPALRRWLRAQLPSNDTAINILDLGCGTGSNLRWLSPRLSGPQHWTLLDNDPQLLAQADLALKHWAGLPVQPGGGKVLQLKNAASATLTRADLERQIPSLDKFHLLSASALLDLISLHWLSTLVEQAAQHGTGLLFALNYDGRMRFTPAHPVDTMIRDALNRDQLTDKGFGPALGPDCVAALHGACLTHGYQLVQWRSDWQLGADERAMHLQLIDDLASIAERQLGSTSVDVDAIQTWRRWRQARINDSTLRIGHVDALALPGKKTSRTCKSLS